jgi:F1F0 ATPase subunit 2
MPDTASFILASLVGVALGIVFFGGLWWTVRKGLSSQLSALWFSGSLLLRTGIALAGFYFVSHGEWPKLLACLLGFLLARFAVTRFTQLPTRLDQGSS